MGNRDHSVTCPTCGEQRGGLNDYKCHCDVLLLRDVQFTNHKLPPGLQKFQRSGDAPADSTDATDRLRQIVRRIVGDVLEHPDTKVVRGFDTACEIADRVVTSIAPLGLSEASVASDHFQRTVTCAWCGNRYRSAIPGDLDQGLQGSHCASNVAQKGEDWFIHCGYGSDEHDMHSYLFVANKPTAPADPICDECISERLRAGDLQDTGLERDRRPADFGPRPFGTWGLVFQIRQLIEREVAMRRLVEAACKEHDARGGLSAGLMSDPCEVRAAIREYRKHQRWCGELEDDGEEYAEGCPEVAGQMREAARRLEDLAAFWERKREG